MYKAMPFAFQLGIQKSTKKFGLGRGQVGGNQGHNFSVLRLELSATASAFVSAINL